MLRLAGCSSVNNDNTKCLQKTFDAIFGFVKSNVYFCNRKKTPQKRWKTNK